MSGGYLHGHGDKERQRLVAQNRFLAELIYERIDLSRVTSLIEFGVGVGAQLGYVLSKYPSLRVTGIDVSQAQLSAAADNLTEAGYAGRFKLILADARHTGLPTLTHHDGGLLVWTLEHISDISAVLTELRRVLLPGSPVYITEVFNRSFFVEPTTPAIDYVWNQMNRYQVAIGGDPNVGVRLGHFLATSGYEQITVAPYPLHFDCRDPARRTAMLKYWFDLVGSSRDGMLKDGLIDDSDWSDFTKDWQQLLETPTTIFFYSFMQATARTPSNRIE